MSTFPSPRAGDGNYKQANVDAIKATVFNNGPLSTSFDSAGMPENVNVTHYYKYAKPPKEIKAGHAVTIIGWDDNIPASSFIPNTPPQNGAFLIKNSWGTTEELSGGAIGTVGLSDHPGCFWMSYYEGSLLFSSLFAMVSANDGYQSMFSYDALGSLGQGASFNDRQDFMANRFTVPAGSAPLQLSAATVFCLIPGTSYTVSVYKNPSKSDPSSGRQLDINSSAATTVTKKLSTSGYHTIDFSKSVALSAGDTFSIVMQVNKLAADDSAIPYEFKMNPQDAGGASIISKEESYFVGEDGNWHDFMGYADSMKNQMTIGNINVKGIARKTALTSLSMKTSGTVLWGMGSKKPVKTTLMNAKFSTGFSDTIAIGDGGVKVTGVNTKKLGTYTATATYQGKSVKFKVKVIGKVSVRTPLSTVYIAKGKSYTLPVVSNAGDSTIKQPLTYDSSDWSVLKVSSKGKLTASKNVKKKTKVTITIGTQSGYEKKVTVYVVPKASKLKKISVSGASASMKKGTYKYAIVKLNPAGATGVKVTYSSSNSKVLTVDKTGKIFAKAKGTATVKVKVGNKTWTKKISVK